MRQVLTTLTIVLVLRALTVGAVPPTWATGDFVLAAQPIVIDVQFADGNTILTETSMFSLTGDLVGTYSGETRSVIRSDGDFTGNGFRTFVGSLDGVGSGTLEFREVFWGDTTVIEGHVTTLDGTGALAGVHCEGTFEGGSLTGVGSYSLRCH